MFLFLETPFTIDSIRSDVYKQPNFKHQKWYEVQYTLEITPHLVFTCNMNLLKLVTCGYYFLYCAYFSRGSVLFMKAVGQLMQECT